MFKRNGVLNLSTTEQFRYSVYFIDNFLDRNLINDQKIWEIFGHRKLLAVIDRNVFNLYEKQIRNFFSKNAKEYTLHTIDADEKTKNMETMISVCALAKHNKLGRNSLLVAIGGGVVMDIVGFAAFAYRRKISYVRIPTTLVGLVDAGVGVKVGVNFLDSKNLLGGYHPPLVVFNDQSFLHTISDKNMRCGLYEILKMAVIKNRKLFNSICKNYQKFLEKNFDNDTQKIIHDSAQYMMSELQNNLFEKNLKRIVDFGHTFSPLLETFSNYEIPHGEAVGIDILLSSYISYRKGLLSLKENNKITEIIKQIGFTKKYELPPINQLFRSLDEVRNHRAGNLNLVIPTKIGKSMFTNKINIEELTNGYLFLKNTNLFLIKNL